MATITYDEVNLMLRLYDLRREPKLLSDGEAPRGE